MSSIQAAMTSSILALAIVSDGHAYIHTITMNASSYRLMDESGGIVGYLGSSEVAATSPDIGLGLFAARPNGSTDWSISTPTQKVAFIGASPSGFAPVGLAKLDSWMTSNYAGTWNYEWNGADPSSFDTTPYYSLPSSLDFVSLTPESLALFHTIRSQGLTGQFTFSIDRFVTSGPLSRHRIQLGGGPIVTIQGSSVTLEVMSALDPTAVLQLSHVSEKIRVEGPVWQVENLEFTSSIYGSAAIPAPGVLALFGLAGIVARRRRA